MVVLLCFLVVCVYFGVCGCALLGLVWFGVGCFGLRDMESFGVWVFGVWVVLLLLGLVC